MIMYDISPHIHIHIFFLIYLFIYLFVISFKSRVTSSVPTESALPEGPAADIQHIIQLT